MVSWCVKFLILIDLLRQGAGNMWVNFSLTDLNKCKVSHDGAEYKGDIRRTIGGALCQSWNTKNPIHEITDNFTDADFVDGKKNLAKNHCRNPKQKYTAPWCFTLDQDLLDDVCQVPLCSFSDCRLTGPGVEYGGNISKTLSGKNCMEWSEKNFRNYKASTSNKSLHSESILDIFKWHKKLLSDSRFPDGTRSEADNYCRNPTGDDGGPWCISKFELPSSEEATYEKNYCFVPFCDEPDCLMFTSGNPSVNQFIHTHWTEIPENAKKTGALGFTIQLWSPAAWKTGELRLALSYLPIPMNGSSLRTFNIGLEVLLSNTKTGIIPARNEEPEWVEVRDLLSGVHRTSVTLNWMKGSVSLNVNKKADSLFLRLYNDKNSILGLLDGPFKYFSLLGTTALWNFPYCLTTCQEHITSSLDFTRVWGLRKFATTRSLSFHVRAKSSVFLEFYLSPSIKFPSIRLELSNSQFKSAIIIQETVNQSRILNSRVSINEVSYWQWKEFSISIIGKKFAIYLVEEFSSITLLEASDPIVSSVDWFSIGSDEVVAHWTLFCSPLELSPIPEAEPPECIMNEVGENYGGTQWITAFGKPCVVWIHDKVLPLVNEAAFPEASLISSLNYCRNPTNNNQGPYCYIFDVDGDPTISYCRPRRCQAVECRRSGSGSDYVGSLNTTLSNRTCISQKAIADFTSSHYSLKRETDGVFCRNENNDPGGPWCFVSDPTVNFDECDVPDCSKTEQSTIIVSGADVSKRGKFFVAPHWKTEGVKFWLKNWNPKLTPGLTISLFNKSFNMHYSFTIGAEMNKKLVLSSLDNEGKEKILKEAVVPYLIKSGKWTGFWSKLPMNRFEFGFKGVMEPLFSINFEPADNKTFFPTYIQFGTFNNSQIGIHFKAKECLAAIAESSANKILFSVNVWSGKNQTTFLQYVQFHLSGSGVTVFEFFRVPSLQLGLIVKLEKSRFEIFSNITKTVLFSYSVPSGFSVNETAWSALEIKIKENVFEATANDHALFQWTSPFPLIYYFFSISNEGGKTVWTANCDPPDIYGDPRNGGWGEWGRWDCSVPCGGGQGARYRQCNKPPPNILGLGCEGPSSIFGACNTHRCGTLSEDTLNLIGNFTRYRAFNQKVVVGDNIHLSCDKELMNLIRTEAPEAELEWTLNNQSVNGVKLKIRNLTSSENSDLRIEKASLSNTGIYICILQSIDDKKVVIQITAVVVWSTNSTSSVRETTSLKLNCHSSVLDNLFHDLQRQWSLNGSVIQNAPGLNLSADNGQIENVHSGFSGEWICIVSQNNLSLSWTTAWMRVKVIGKPTFWTRLLEEDARSMIYGYTNKSIVKTVFFFIYMLIAIGLGCSGYYYNKWVKEFHVETK